MSDEECDSNELEEKIKEYLECGKEGISDWEVTAQSLEEHRRMKESLPLARKLLAGLPEEEEKVRYKGYLERLGWGLAEQDRIIQRSNKGKI